MSRHMRNLAGLSHARGDPAVAEALARSGIAIREGLPGLDPHALAEDNAALAAILIDLGRLSEAGAILRRVLRTSERVYGPVHYEIATNMKIAVLGGRPPDLVITLHNLG